MKTIQTKIKAFIELEENWNSYGAKTIEQNTIDRAIEFYEHLIEAVPHIATEIDEPFVCPCCDGSVKFTWTVYNRKFACEIPEYINAKYSWLESEKEEGRETIYKTGALQSMSRLIKVIKDWMLKPRRGGFQ